MLTSKSNNGFRRGPFPHAWCCRWQGFSCRLMYGGVCGERMAPFKEYCQNGSTQERCHHVRVPRLARSAMTVMLRNPSGWAERDARRFPPSAADRETPAAAEFLVDPRSIGHEFGGIAGPPRGVAHREISAGRLFDGADDIPIEIALAVPQIVRPPPSRGIASRGSSRYRRHARNRGCRCRRACRSRRRTDSVRRVVPSLPRWRSGSDASHTSAIRRSAAWRRRH